MRHCARIQNDGTSWLPPAPREETDIDLFLIEKATAWVGLTHG
jgi:hypothetical protein